MDSRMKKPKILRCAMMNGCSRDTSKCIYAFGINPAHAAIDAEYSDRYWIHNRGYYGGDCCYGVTVKLYKDGSVYAEE